MRKMMMTMMIWMCVVREWWPIYARNVCRGLLCDRAIARKYHWRSPHMRTMRGRRRRRCRMSVIADTGN